MGHNNKNNNSGGYILQIPPDLKNIHLCNNFPLIFLRQYTNIHNCILKVIYSVSQNTLRISIVNYIRLVRRIDLIILKNFWYIYGILFFTLLLIIGGLQAKLC